MPLDHFVTLGRSGLKVSPLCLGAMTFGEEFGFGSNLATSKQIVRNCEESLRAVNDLVHSGKVRYIGFSDTPAWRVAQALMLALARGWARLIALQIEYSLLEQTVEGELIPVAREFGLGVTPWSPLRSGFLSGKYSRTNTQAASADRAAWIQRNYHEQGFRVIDALASVAQAAGTTPARCALAWVCARPGVSSPIIGARTVQQLDENLAALEVRLTP